MKSPSRSFLPSLLVLVCAMASAAIAQQRSFPSYVGHVNDFANVIDAGTEEQMETILNNFEKMTGTQIAAVTIQSLNGRPVEDYALGLYRAWGIGAKSGENKDKGALLLIALEDRKTRLEVGYGLEGDLPDGLAGEIIRRMRPFLQQGQYSQGMNVGVRTLVDTLAQKWNVNITGIEDRSYAYSGSPEPQVVGVRGVLILVGFCILFFIVMLIIARSSRKGGGGGSGGGNNLWWLYPIIFNRGGGSFGGGSWGSGGGGSWGGGGSDWGGFGGGSSGGGGASDSW
jgi:uncharacterized protein